MKFERIPKPTRPVAWVTGAVGSLGRPLCLRLAQEGYDLILHGRKADGRLWSLAHDVEAEGARVALFTADLSQPHRVPSLCARVGRWSSRLDLLVNGASAFFPTPRGGKPAAWDLLYRTNAVTPYLLARAAAALLARTRGSVVNLIDAYVDHPVLSDHAAYLASKAALRTLTLVLARELAPSVRVNGVSPGAITFPSHYSRSRRQAVARRSVLKRSGCPEDVVQAVLYLAGASFVTGQILNVDGGRFS